MSVFSPTLREFGSLMGPGIDKLPFVSEEGKESSAGPARCFVTTHWSVVLAARGADSPEAAEALSRLCQTYWYPLYAYVRRRGHEAVDAQDLTQEFFARLLEKNFLKSVQQERGKFRWFLLSALKRFLANEWNQQHAAKRGGKCITVSLDDQNAEGRYALEVADQTTPEKLFDRNWAMTVIEQAQDELRREYETSGRGPLFDQLKVFLSGDRASISQAEVGAALEMQEGAVKVAVHRLRRRYQDHLREQIAQTVSTPAEVEEEIRQLFAAFSA
jgi:RNA polymerase sigma-70 factor (ECF subfamily)